MTEMTKKRVEEARRVARDLNTKLHELALSGVRVDVEVQEAGFVGTRIASKTLDLSFYQEL